MKTYLYAYMYLYLWVQYILTTITADNSYSLRLRNSLLRIYIANDKKQFLKEYSNQVINKSKLKLTFYYNKIVSKFHDINIAYYNLTDEQRELIDFIVALQY